MKKLASVAGALMWLSLLRTSALATIIVTVQPGFFSQDSGRNSLNLLARSTAPTSASDRLVGFVADIQLAAGVLSTPPGAYGNATLGYPGTFLFSHGELNPASRYFRDSDVAASLSLDFNSIGVFPSTDSRIATIDIDVNGLTPGVYNVTLPFLEMSNTVNTLSGRAVDGSFTIRPLSSSIPEPSSLGVWACLVATGATRFRRSRT